MNLTEYCSLLSTKQRHRFAELAGTAPDHLFQLTGGWRRPSTQLAWRLVTASRRQFRKQPARWLTMDEIFAESRRIYRGPGSKSFLKKQQGKLKGERAA